MSTRVRALTVVAAVLVLAGWQARPSSQGPPPVTTPQQALGASIGDDYFLANYTQLEQYWKAVDRESDRVVLSDIGRTEEGRTHWMAIVSAPENLASLERYKEISRRLALAEGLTDEQARALAREGRAVVWIDGGLHANEVLGSQQLVELVYRLASASDEETLRFLRDVIVLVVNANPDGHELVANWYMRDTLPHRRSLDGVPRAYQKYVGHDNNRDFYLSSQAETVNMNRVLYREWFPQIVLDHHQSSPAGTVMFAPPFRDPFNYVFDPLIPIGIELVGAAMHARFAAEGKPGVTMRRGSTYSTWWNGGLRTTAYFHNQIGLLAETMGDPTPTEIPLVSDRQQPSADLPFPIAPQPWRFRQSIEYVMTANRAVIDVASRFRETFLLNAFRMGRNAIDRGSRDSWTLSPRRIASLTAAAGRRPPAKLYEERLRDPALRDPRGYVLPSSQPDFLTALKFADALIRSGVVVHRATSAFAAGGKTYPAGSLVVKTAQAFRPHVLDMFEPQDHPDDIPYAGAAPTPPYDIAGWTLAFQMGVQFDRLLDGFDGPFERLGASRPPPGRVAGATKPAGYFVSHHQNDAFIAVNRLLSGGEAVYWLRDRTAGGLPGTTGAIYVAAGAATRPRLEQMAAELGLTFTGSAAPDGEALRLAPVRVALWDQYGGSSSSGWIRWILERFECPYEIVFAAGLDAGNLSRRYDVIVLPDEAVPGRGADGGGVENVPAQYRGALGRMSWERTVPELKRFVEEGGTLLAIGGATGIAERLGVPVTSALTSGDSTRQTLRPSEFYVPGSILRVAVDNTVPAAFGFFDEVDVFFDSSPAFRLGPRAREAGVRRVAWFASPAPLRSGWAWGQKYLDGAVAAVDAPLGKGRVLLFGPEIAYRAQSHGTFKFLFNGIHSARARAVRLPEPRATR
jgi:hypothetical protein